MDISSDNGPISRKYQMNTPLRESFEPNDPGIFLGGEQRIPVDLNG